MSATYEVQSSSSSLPFYISKRDVAHFIVALSTIAVIGSVFSLIALSHHNLGPLNALSHLSKGGAIALLTFSTFVIGIYTIWAKFFKKPLVKLKNETGEITYIRPGIKKWLRRLFQETFFEAGKIKDRENAFSNPKKPEQLASELNDLNLLWEVCEKKGLLKELYFEIVSHPSAYLYYGPPVMHAPSLDFAPLNLSECACKTHAFNRIAPQTHNRRKVFEKAIVEHVVGNLPDKADCVKFIDMGCGNLLEPWIIIGLLMKKGYQNFEIQLVDPNINPHIRSSFEDFFIKLGVSVKVTTADSINEVTNFEAHFISAIDFDKFNDANPRAELIRSASFLKNDGKLFLGYGDDRDYEISKSQVNSGQIDFANAKRLLPPSRMTLFI